MNEQLKLYIAKLALIWIFIGALLSLPAACMKAGSAFYHQVIVKDQVAGEIKQK